MLTILVIWFLCCLPPTNHRNRNNREFIGAWRLIYNAFLWLKKHNSMVVLVTATQYNESVGWKFEITKTGEQFYRVVSEFWQIKPVLSHLWGAKITRVIAIHYVCVNNRMQAKWLIRNHCSGENLTKKKLLWMRQSSIRAFIHKSQVSISIIQTLRGSPLSSSGQSSHMLMRNQKFCHRIPGLNKSR